MTTFVIMTVFYRLIFAIIAVAALAGCNDDVFVKLPPQGDEPGSQPTPPDEPEPFYPDSLILTAFDYFENSIELTDELWEQDAVTHFYNHDSEGTMTVLFDNYNSTLVSISNSTYYVTPWAKEDQMYIDIPCLDIATDEVTIRPHFMPFKFGITSVKGQLMPGGTSSLTIPGNTQVKATVYTTRRKIAAKAQIAYYNTAYPNTTETGWANVIVWQPVDIRVEWSDVQPIEGPR